MKAPNNQPTRLKFSLLSAAILILVILRAIAQIRREQQHWEKIEAHYRQIREGRTDLETFACLADFVADEAVGDYDHFMLDLNHLILGAHFNLTAIIAGPLYRIIQYLFRRLYGKQATPAFFRFGSSGFAADDGSNQVQHFWYAVAITYALGPRLAEWQAVYHEWNGPGLLRYLPGSGHGYGTAADLHLSRQGIDLGQKLAARLIPLEMVGDWLRQELR